MENKMSLKTGLIGIGLATFFVPSVLAQVTLLTQERGITRRLSWVNLDPLPEGGSTSSGAAYWSDFGPFSMQVLDQRPRQPADPYVSCQQELWSVLSPSNIKGVGGVTSSITTNEEHIGTNVDAASIMRVGFAIEGPTRYRLVGHAVLTIGHVAYSRSRIGVSLTGPTSPVFSEVVDGEGESEVAFNQYGFFMVGTHLINVESRAHVSAEVPLLTHDDASFDVELEMGCPADFNFDGVTTSQDFFEFLTAFFAMDVSADYTVDGRVDSQDFFSFLTWFLPGC